MNLTRTGLIVLISVIFVAGVGTAYAGIVMSTITLAGNVVITGDTKLEGKLLDTSNDAGSSGQVLSSTMLGIDWVDAMMGSTIPPKPHNNILTDVDSTATDLSALSITVAPDGFPVISYAASSGLKVAKCGNATCSSGNTLSTVVTGSFISPAIAIGTDGLPLISYGVPGVALKVVMCGNAACSSGNTINTVDSSNAGHTSIAIGTDGLPVISYQTSVGGLGKLKVAKCGNATCSSGSPTLTIIDSVGVVGRESSIAIGHDRLPVISYVDDSNGALKVAKCGNESCSSGSPTLTTIDPGPGILVGIESSIAVAPDGFPVISYIDFNNRDLKVAKCTNASCTAFGTTLVDNAPLSRPLVTSIAIGIDGFQIISYGYQDVTVGQGLRVAKCLDASCSTFLIIVVDSPHPASDTSITMGTDWLPIISYTERDGSNEIVKVAKCATPE